jgi:hypothetical protein
MMGPTTCKCDPCECDPCECDPCECDPCECDPCECGTHKSEAPRPPTPMPTDDVIVAVKDQTKPLTPVAEDEVASQEAPEASDEQAALVQVVIADDTRVPLDAASITELRERIANLELTPASVITVMRHAMEIVEGLTVKGEAQKDIAVALVKEVLEGTDIDAGLLAGLVDGGMLSSAVELVIAATQGDLAVNVRRRARRFCGC